MSWKEPLTGYTEGFHGINGWCLACSAGVLRTLECQYDNPSLIVPCDIVTNGLIVLAYERSKIKYVILLFTHLGQYFSWK